MVVEIKEAVPAAAVLDARNDVDGVHARGLERRQIVTELTTREVGIVDGLIRILGVEESGLNDASCRQWDEDEFDAAGRQRLVEQPEPVLGFRVDRKALLKIRV